MSRLLIWDLPTRLFHWLFAFAFVLAYILGEEDDWLGWHTYFGYLVGGIVLFRLVWGFAGGHFSRFSNFPRQSRRRLAIPEKPGRRERIPSPRS